MKTKDSYDKPHLFLACPVRGIDPKAQLEQRDKLIPKLEKHYNVHWPPRDTNQNDDTGIRICQHNRAAIKRADIVGIIWDGKSQGVLFDLGMAFALDKPIKIIDIPRKTDGKSFQNMITAWRNQTWPDVNAIEKHFKI